VLLVADVVFIAPFWRPLVKSDHEGWQRIFFVAKFGLPAAFVLGALTGLAWRWSRPFRLGFVGLIGCCLAVAWVSVSLRPVVARVSTNRWGPLYEVVPDTMAATFGLGALLIAASAVLRHIREQLRSQTSNGERAAEAPDRVPPERL
jgi:hypothetical protein